MTGELELKECDTRLEGSLLVQASNAAPQPIFSCTFDGRVAECVKTGVERGADCCVETAMYCWCRLEKDVDSEAAVVRGLQCAGGAGCCRLAGSCCRMAIAGPATPSRGRQHRPGAAGSPG